MSMRRKGPLLATLLAACVGAAILVTAFLIEPGAERDAPAVKPRIVEATDLQAPAALRPDEGMAGGKALDAQGLMVLFAVPWPPQGIYAKKDLNSVADMKGLKWRAYNVGTARIAEIVGAQPLTIQAAELPQALATGVVDSFMSSGATGYDSKVWESLSHFYDTQAWLPNNITFVNKAAFAALDKPTQDAVLKAAADAEERGRKISEEKTNWFFKELQAKGMKVQPPSASFKAELAKVGETLTADWAKKAGAAGEAAVAAYKK